MPIALLFPRFDHPAVEERYGSWQTQMRLRSSTTGVIYYDPDEKIAGLADAFEEEHVLVVTDPLLVAAEGLASRLLDALMESGAAAALPVTNGTANEDQRCVPPASYLTLRELEAVAATMRASQAALRRTVWNDTDPGVFLCSQSTLRSLRGTARHALSGHDVAIDSREYIHRWASLRGQVREDLLALIDTSAKSILEFGCGEAPLGEALKKRQRCRVVGIEIDRQAAAVARKRIDDVYCADAREIVSILEERFDWIVGGDIVEHLDEPWTFLAELRRLSQPGGHLLLSLPNVANASIVADLLHGRFDYGYMGLTCAGHLRFFTRRSIEEMLTIAGWSAVEIRPQETAATAGRDEILSLLGDTVSEYATADLLTAGYYVIAKNPG